MLVVNFLAEGDNMKKRGRPELKFVVMDVNGLILAENITNKEISERFGIPIHTVKYQTGLDEKYRSPIKNKYWIYNISQKHL